MPGRVDQALRRSHANAQGAQRDSSRRLVGPRAPIRLGVFASAVAFRILLALAPFALFALALLGFLSLDEV